MVLVDPTLDVLWMVETRAALTAGGNNGDYGIMAIIHGCSRPSGTLVIPGFINAIPRVIYPQPPQECQNLSAGITHQPSLVRFWEFLGLCLFQHGVLSSESISISFSLNLKMCLDDPSSLGALLCVSPVWCGW